jgi:hypothetical protein
MGAEPYEYFVPYERNIQAALDKLREHVFASGEFNGAEFNPATPEEALEMADADGTASILDIQRIADHPDYFCAAPLSPKELNQYFGTDKPTRKDVQHSDEFWDSLDRGQARYVVLYQGGQPTELYFAGYSFD